LAVLGVYGGETALGYWQKVRRGEVRDSTALKLLLPIASMELQLVSRVMSLLFQRQAVSHQGLQCLCTSARFAFVPMHVEMVTVITMFIQKILAGGIVK
jgi:hypothetical protein